MTELTSPVDARYAGDLAVSSLEYLEAALPGLVARPGSIETVLTEANAQAVAEVIGTANATAVAVVEDLLSRYFQVPRLPGASAVGEVTLTFDGVVSQTIPAGVRMVLPGVELELATTAEVVVSSASSVVVQVATVAASSRANSVGAGAPVDVLDIVPRLLSVELSTGMTGGVDPESDGEYVIRAANRCARVTNSLAVPGAFSAFVLEDGRAVNALAIRAWDGASVGTAGTDAQHVTVVTYGRGANLSAGVRAEVAAAMQEITAAGVTVHVNPAVLTTVPVNVTVKARGGYAAVDVANAVTAAVAAYLAPESWPIGADVEPLALTSLIARVPSVDYVSSLTAPAALVSIPVDGVASPDDITVGVI